MYLVVGLNVASVVGLYKSNAGAEITGFAYRRPCFDAACFGFVTGGDAASGFDAQRGYDPDGFAAQMRLELLFDGGKKAVEVDKEVAQAHYFMCNYVHY